VYLDNNRSPVGQKVFFENREQICDKLLFALIYSIGNVVHPVQNPHSVVTWDFSYSTLNIVFSAVG